jgi:hypothetical protein
MGRTKKNPLENTLAGHKRTKKNAEVIPGINAKGN